MKAIDRRDPVFPPAYTPSYSNAGFSLLGIALEAITGRTFSEVMENDVFKPLGMSDSSVVAPKNSKGVIPVGDSLWGLNLGAQNA